MNSWWCGGGHADDDDASPVTALVFVDNALGSFDC